MVWPLGELRIFFSWSLTMKTSAAERRNHCTVNENGNGQFTSYWSIPDSSLESMLKVHLVGSNHWMRVQMTSLESPKETVYKWGHESATPSVLRDVLYTSLTYLDIPTTCTLLVLRIFQWRHLDAHAVIGSHQMHLGSDEKPGFFLI